MHGILHATGLAYRPDFRGLVVDLVAMLNDYSLRIKGSWGGGLNVNEAQILAHKFGVKLYTTS